jgi:hypothetical protein
MHSKRLQGSHFGNSKQAHAANNLVLDGAIDPCMSEVFEWDKIPFAHEKMLNNEHKAGNMAVLVGAQRRIKNNQGRINIMDNLLIKCRDSLESIDASILTQLKSKLKNLFWKMVKYLNN